MEDFHNDSCRADKTIYELWVSLLLFWGMGFLCVESKHCEGFLTGKSSFWREKGIVTRRNPAVGSVLFYALKK